MTKVFSDETRRRMSEAAKLRCTPEWRQKRSQEQATKLPVDDVRRLYESGKTQVEIAQFFGTTQKVIWRFMRVNQIKARVPIKRNQMGDKNDSWKGDAAGYAAFHKRLDSLYGRPKQCDVCGTTDTARKYDWANLTGRYEDATDFKRMCRSCHSKYDNKIQNILNAGGRS